MKLLSIIKLTSILVLPGLTTHVIAVGNNSITLTELSKNTLESAEFSCTYATPLKNNKTGKIVAVDAHNGFYMGINNQQYKVKNRQWNDERLTGSVKGYQLLIKRTKILKEKDEYLKSLVNVGFYQSKRLVKNFSLIETCEH